MNTRPLRNIGIAVLTLGLLAGCNQATQASSASKGGTSSPGAVATSPQEPSPDTVVATWGNGGKVTYGQLEAKIKRPLEALDQRKAMIRQKGLEGMVTEALVDEAAKKQGQTEQEFLKAQLDQKVKQPGELEIKRFYARNKSRLPPSATYESMKPKIIQVLVSRQKHEVATSYFKELRDQAHVKFMLPKSLLPKPHAPGPFGLPPTLSPHAAHVTPHAMPSTHVAAPASGTVAAKPSSAKK